MEEQKVKRPTGRPRLPEEEKKRRQAEKKASKRSRAMIVENAKKGIDMVGIKGQFIKTEGDFAESNKAIMELLYEASLPKVRSDEELYTRFVEYFQRCAQTSRIPTIEEAMLCTGYSWIAMQKTRAGERKIGWATSQTPEIIEWAVELCKTYDAKMVMAGKLPQVPYIFRSKNFYGMRDQVEQVVVQVSPDVKPSLEDIAKRYGYETTFVEDEASSDN
jgi:hypothetical protein